MYERKQRGVVSCIGVRAEDETTNPSIQTLRSYELDRGGLCGRDECGIGRADEDTPTSTLREVKGVVQKEFSCEETGRGQGGGGADDAGLKGGECAVLRDDLASNVQVVKDDRVGVELLEFG